MSNLHLRTHDMERVTSHESPSYGGDGHSSASDEDANPVEVNTLLPPFQPLPITHLSR